MSLTDNDFLADSVTLTNCDREPIHIPGAIQPYGFLLCLDPTTQLIVHASANTGALLGLPAESLLGGGLDQLLGPARLAEVAGRLGTLTETAQLLGARLEAVAGQPYYKLIMHRYDGLLWVEFEPVAETDATPLDLAFLNAALGQMLAAPTVREFCQHAVAQVRAVTGFDRVAIYRFAPDESGEIIAEDIAAGLAPWLGLHYPASDIPQQARAMYLKNWLRFIPDAAYQPVPLVPVRNPATGRPPDMTYAVLRSVSPIHLEYLHHLGSAATMTVSLIDDGKLWGMLTCHHRTPRLVGFELRELCQFIGKTFSALLAGKVRADQHAYQLQVREQLAQLLEHVTRADDFVGALAQPGPTIQEVFDCGGAAVCFGDEVHLLGDTPPEAAVRELLAWLADNAPGPLFHTDSLAAHYPAGAPALRATASGLIAAALADAPGHYLLWFRPEVVQTVTWAGRNDKPQLLADGQIFLSPRQSFEAWKQLVEHTAVPWLPLELAAAREIRQHVADLQLKAFNELQARAQSLSALNTALERSNDELDSFAYVASHDLKEPLRGIHNYALFLLEDYADQLDADGVHKLQTLVRLSQRMEGLISSLFELSQVGRTDLVVVDLDAGEVLAEATDLLRPRFEQTHTELVVAGAPWPTVRGDRVRLLEVFGNLLSNAMKYNNQPTKTVTVGQGPAAPGEPAAAVNLDHYYLFYVRDNGIGIDAKHHGSIFKLFKRLHGQDKYGGGTGAGLAIAKKMVEKHGGQLWVESALGHGATFYFTLSKNI
ncbi:ATP-binding protein [Hymenobacter nivis]|uniref:histidine kinase n=1 Tax=Hymenobacter nivis TaxID=1850093 RepID=A0A502GX59_9BACT|nr:ATP-binding protein [Hymenobacter nivis]TPG65958.1 GAF domain-containing protein [Hymenobacter nivis]